MSGTWSRLVALVGVGLVSLAGEAQGQYGGSREKADAQIISRVKPHDWTLTAMVGVRVDQFGKDAQGMPLAKGFTFDTVAVVFPVPGETATSVTAPVRPLEGADPGRRYATGKLMLNDRVVDEHPTFVGDYAAGTRLGKWTYRDWAGQEMSLEVTIPVTCYQTKFDEALAREAKWPDSWPPAAASCLQPQYWVDLDPAAGPYDMAPVKDFVKRITRGKDPKSVPPAVLAKVIAGEVLEAVQPSGQGLNFNRLGELEGMDLQGAPATLLRGKGSEFDIVCVLAAAYRTAGLPARTVIGYDTGDGDGGRFLAKKGSSGLRAWVEFPLMDAKAKKMVWVPVDVNRMRKSGSRARPLDQRWPYFGEHDEMDGIIPFAFQFHPPTTVVSHGSPAFWGWLVTPRPPERVMQTVRFRAITTPVTLEDQKRKQQEERERRKK